MPPVRPIRVLVVDDEPDLCALTKSFLEASKVMEVDTVCSVAEARTALGQKHYDVIVSDYQMPKEDGIQFLKSLRGKGDRIPFILFTGKGREEVVIEALNHGADSYLQKGGNPAPQYVELEQRIRAAVQKHRSEEALQESETRYERLAEHAGTIAWEVDADGFFTYVSHVSEVVWGYRPDELVGKKHFYDLHPESGRDAFKTASFAIFERKERFHDLVTPLLTKDGRTMWVTTDGIPLLNEDGTLQGYQGSDTDITARKRAEGALRAMNESVDGIALLGPDERYWYVNRAHLRTYGYDKEEELLGCTWHCLYEAKELDRFRRQIMPELGAKGSWRGEAMGRRKDGSLFPQELSLTVTEGGRMICVVRDITDRKQAAWALEEKEEYLRTILQTTADGFWMVDSEGGIADVNDAYCRMLGYSRAELLKLRIPDIDAMLTLEEQAATIQKIVNNGSGVFETRHRRKDGSVVDVELSVAYLNRNGGNLICFCRDITERKMTEEALRESEIRFRTMFQESPLGIALIDSHSGHIHEVNERFAEIAGRSQDEMQVIDWMSITHPEDVQEDLDQMAHLNAGDIPGFQMRKRYLKPDGSNVWIRMTIAPLKELNFPRQRHLCMIEDITERKKAQEALHHQNELRQNILDSIPVMVGLFDHEGHYEFANRCWQSTLGWSLEEMQQHEDIFAEFYPDPEYRKYVQEYIESAAGSGRWSDFKTRIRNGRSLDTSWINIPLSDGSIIGIGVDVTERKLTEGALQESEEKFREIFNNANDGIQIHEMTEDGTPGRFIEVNDVICRMLGYTREEMLQRKPTENSTGYYDPPIEKVLESLRVTGSARLKTELRRKDGSTISVEANDHILDLNGRLVMIGVIRDITERKMTEDALHLANRKLNLLSNITRHDINNQLMVLEGNLTLLEKKQKDNSSDEHLKKAEAAAERISAMIQFTREYEDIGVKAPAWVSPGRQTANAFEMLHPHEATLDDNTGDIEVLADPLVEKVPHNLIDNSMRHGERVTRIGLSAEQRGDAMMIIYEDNGVGISAEDKKRLFEKGFGKNTGFGLFLIREILAITDITIMETGSVGEGARFEMLVPAGAWRHRR